MENNLSNISLIELVNQMDLLQVIVYRLPQCYDEINKQYEELRQELARRFPPLGENDELKLKRKSKR